MYCCTQSALQSYGGGLSSTTTSVQHPLGWCDGCHRTTAPVRSPHTSYRWRGERVIEPIKCMLSPHTSYRWRGERDIEPIKCMLSPHTSYRWRGERDIEPIKGMGIIRRPWLTRACGGNFGQDTGVTLLLFTRSALGFLMTTVSQDLGLTSHPKDGIMYNDCLLFWTPLTLIVWTKMVEISFKISFVFHRRKVLFTQQGFAENTVVSSVKVWGCDCLGV